MNRILVLLHHQGNRRLLSEWLGHYFDVVVPGAAESIQEPWDLLIADGPAIERHHDAIQAQRSAATPIFLPCLLLTPRQSASASKRHLGQAVDELLWTPIDKDELYTRVNILLNGRKQSLENSTMTS